MKRRFPNEPEYHQAVEEVLNTIEDTYNRNIEFEKSNLIERLCIPDRIFSFRVTWTDDQGNVHTNMGYRIQHNNAIGPYKGGIRFHSSVNLSILKFLAFEQTFKNSLTTLPMGGAKGGSDFNPKGKSNAEIMRFCQAYILELWRNIGPGTDIPAGDIGVGGREVNYMYGMYKKLARENSGTFTGKGLESGGSLIRPEATGYGNVYFLLEMLKTRNIELKGKTVAYSYGTYSETILTNALNSVCLTMADITPMDMDAANVVTAMLSGGVDACAIWSPQSLTILDEMEGATKLAQNTDFSDISISLASWIAMPEYLEAHHDVAVRFMRALLRAMDYAALEENYEEVSGWVADFLALDVEDVLIQARGDADWLTGKEVLAGIDDGTVDGYYELQQEMMVSSGAITEDQKCPVSDYVIYDIIKEAGNY